MLKLSTHWNNCPNNIELSHKTIHVWMINLQEHLKKNDIYYRLLSEYEYNRAHQYRFEKDKQRFIIARGILRELIGRYLLISPKEMVFSYNLNGKPYLNIEDTTRTLWFNLSHSENIALYIFSKWGEVGIDVEKIKPMADMEEIAKRFFSQNESRILQLIPVSERLEAFYRCWTRKEAFIKMIGNGLSYPLEDFEVTLEPEKPAKLLKVREQPKMVENLALVDVHPCNGYVGALVAEKPLKTLEFWKY